MPGVPPVHTITLRASGDRTIHNFSATYSIGVGSFARGGETGCLIGKIVSIDVAHAHSCSYNGTYTACATLRFSDGSSVSSNWNQQTIRGWTWYGNSFGTLPTPEQFAKFAQLDVTLNYVTAWQRGQLTWQASSEYPVTITVRFYDARDMVEGASPPTVSGVSIADTAGHLGAFGSCVQGQSRLRITGQYKLDPNYIYLSATHTLTLSCNGRVLFTAAQTDNAVFDVGALDASGTVAWSYNVLDTAGNSVTRAGSFDVLAYSPPVISGFAVERYAIDVDDMGQPVYTLANDGSHVWISLSAGVTGVAGKNAWRLELLYGSDEAGVAEKTVAIASGADAGSAARERDRAIVSEVVSPTNSWEFRLRLTDRFTTAESVVMVARGAALFNIEEYGVAVGMYATGREGAKKFQVGGDYESEFFGGVRGVTNYSSDEVDTGGRWIDGKPVFRKTYFVEIPADRTDSTKGPDGKELGPCIVDETFTPSYVDRVIYVQGCFYYGEFESSERSIFPMPFSNSVREYNVFPLIEADGLKLSLGSALTLRKKYITITIAYTRRKDGVMVLPYDIRFKASASSRATNNNWPPANAFDGNEDTGWISDYTYNDEAPWLQVQMDVALKNIIVEVHARSRFDPFYNPVAGKILGSNDGESWEEIGAYSGWNGTQQGGVLGTVRCGNTKAYCYVRITAARLPDGAEWAAIGDVKISGDFDRSVALPAGDPGIQGPGIMADASADAERQSEEE